MINFNSQIRDSFKRANVLTRLIYINIGVYILIKFLSLFFFLLNRRELDATLLGFLALPADTGVLLVRPWTLVTYMFLHYGFFHILFNMLWLFWFGKIFLEYLDARKLTAIYLIGGFAGGLLYIAAYNLLPAFRDQVPVSIALGASAAILAVVMTISFYVPDYRVNLMFIGPVKIKYIALGTILIDLFSIQSGNAGGHIAHLGGALFGILYAWQLTRGKDLVRGFNKLLDALVTLFKPRPKMRVKYKKPRGRPETDMEYNARKSAEQAEIDRILEKISKNGYAALTKEEKEKLFTSSKR
ncbi:MAG: rhomboid family intramembrane serine protease [Bacteroidales bacterium]|nr:rhomboid family intramembrane serine protease [Bacteroidales bacterium]